MHLIDKTVLESSLNLLISIIAHRHFQSDQCIAYYNSGKGLNYVSPLAESFPVVLNDYECNHGCRQYIIEDPSVLHELNFSMFKSCMILNRNTDMHRVIIFRKVFKPHDASFLNSIFIEQEGRYFLIQGRSNLELHFVNLNRWDIESKIFVDKSGANIDAFFDDRWKTHPNAYLSAVMNFDYPLMVERDDGRPQYFSIDLIILKYWADNLNITFNNYMVYFNQQTDMRDWACPIPKHAFILGYRSGQMFYPQSYPSIDMTYTYFVPKPKVYNHWLQLVAVFEISIWILLLLSALFIAGYFWVEMLLTKTPLNSPFLSLCGLFLLQSLGSHQVPRQLRSRFILALALIIIVIYSSLFASCVVTQIVSPRYEREIRTEDEIEKFGYKKYTQKDHAFSNFAITDDCELNFAELMKRVGSLQGLTNVSLSNNWVFASLVTITGLSPHSAENYRRQRKPLKDGRERTNTHILAGNSAYACLLPQVNDFILRCKETGLIIKLEWFMYMSIFNMTDILRYLDYGTDPIPPKIFNLTDLQAPFWFLIYGCIVAFCGFFVELIHAFIIRAKGLCIIAI